ncbi:hypothetical protein Nepgr_019123 [Nepenthes gracilis]|uniref:C2 domain-containing protein n=1 Tax=Nepenthes gracilis TaxID=150966 RepID=A0AAD3SV92_NEPGR|nr:hypothetical protein Nepgr_019123 [Nepenthes gracilis]
METHLLEVNLISAQGLKTPVSKLRRLRTYAVAWVDSSSKLRTRIDRVGADHPTWNDRFIFRVSSDFLHSETSGVTVEIFAVGVLKDPLIGTVRFLISNFLPTSFSLDSVSEDPKIPGIGIPAFNAFQIRRASGRYHGVLNVGVMVLTNGADFAGLNGVAAIGYRDLMGMNFKRQSNGRSRSQISEDFSAGDSCGNSCADSADFSDGAESTKSSASSAASTYGTPPPTVLKELNGRGLMAAANDCNAILCGLGIQKKIHIRPPDENIRIFRGI